MNTILKKALFLNHKWPVRIWMWTSVGCVAFYLLKFAFIENALATVVDMVIMAYGVGSIGIYTLLYGFDWS